MGNGRSKIQGRLLNRSDAARYLGKHRRTLEVWERRGWGPPVVRLPSGLPAYIDEDLDDFIESLRQTAKEESR